MHVVGLDIGGANVKVATTAGSAVSVPFPLWKDPGGLPATLRVAVAKVLSEAGPDVLAVTMTGELADCFPSKADGVAAILDAVAEAFPGIPLAVWQVAGEFVDAATARAFPLLTAASNWHALATFCGRLAPQGSALLVDVGSTTTDIVPLHDGIPMPQGRTDVTRLVCGELIYRGVRRTPLCALLKAVPWEGRLYPLAAEVFATSGDAWLILGRVPERPEDRATADGRPAIQCHARHRIARQFCADEDELPQGLIEATAEAVAARQRATLRRALQQVVRSQKQPPDRVILSGEGSFLAKDVLADDQRYRNWSRVELDRLLGADISAAACAFAVARLAEERWVPFL